MTFRSDSITRLVCLTGCALVIGGCRPRPGGEEDSPPAANLGVAALQTHARYVKAVNAGVQERSDEIAPKYWAEEIQRLDPIKVYRHRWNVVVVQKAAPGREEGKYISTLISSYRPRSGDDGFTFTEIGDGVFDYTRVIAD